MISVNEIFTSIQGEGIHTGLPTTFIRLAGCDLRCRWCDTPYALSIDQGEGMELDSIVERISSSPAGLVCITGGEPLIQCETNDLIRRLLEMGYSVDLETNGANDVSLLPLDMEELMLSMDVKTPSSGEDDSFLIGNLDHMRCSDQLKFIIDDDVDLDFTFDFLRSKLPGCNVILTPCSNSGGEAISGRLMDELNEAKEPLREVLERTRIMIQTHKVIWEPGERGV